MPAGVGVWGPKFSNPGVASYIKKDSASLILCDYMFVFSVLI